MNCKTCIVRDFVHSDLYCRGCLYLPEPEMKTGLAYLYRTGAFNPISSVEIEAPEGMEYEVSAVELMQQFRIEFIESGGNELSGANSQIDLSGTGIRNR